MTNSIIIAGCGGQAKVVIDIVEQLDDVSISGLLDSFQPKGHLACGYEVLGDESWDCGEAHVHVAIGDSWARAGFVRNLKENNHSQKFFTAVHPKACVAKDVTIGAGSVVMAGAVINPGVTIGEHCIINTGAVVDHDCKVGDYVNVYPGATLGGNVLVGAFSTVALGASVIHGISIGEHSVVGAGAVVVQPIPDNVVVLGVPGKVVRTRERGERFL